MSTPVSIEDFVVICDFYIAKCKYLHTWYTFLDTFSHIPISIESIFVGGYLIYSPRIPDTTSKHIVHGVIGGIEILLGLMSCSAYVLQYGRKSFHFKQVMTRLQHVKQVMQQADVEAEGSMMVSLSEFDKIILENKSLQACQAPSPITPSQRDIFASIKAGTLYNQYVMPRLIEFDTVKVA